MLQLLLLLLLLLMLLMLLHGAILRVAPLGLRHGVLRAARRKHPRRLRGVRAARVHPRRARRGRRRRAGPPPLPQRGQPRELVAAPQRTGMRADKPGRAVMQRRAVASRKDLGVAAARRACVDYKYTCCGRGEKGCVCVLLELELVFLAVGNNEKKKRRKKKEKKKKKKTEMMIRFFFMFFFFSQRTTWDGQTTPPLNTHTRASAPRPRSRGLRPWSPGPPPCGAPRDSPPA
jgi:hypothetical protein